MLNFGVVIHLYNWLVLNLLLNPIAWKVVPLDQRWKTLTATLKIWVFFGGWWFASLWRTCLMIIAKNANHPWGKTTTMKHMENLQKKKRFPSLKKNYNPLHFLRPLFFEEGPPPPRKNRNGVVGTTGTKKPSPPGACMHCSKEASKVHLPGPTDPWVMEVMVAMMALIRTWRIIPFSKWLITMVSKSPNWGYSPYKWPKWLINRGY